MKLAGRPRNHPIGIALAGLFVVAALPGLAFADVGPSPPQFEDCTANYREKGDTTCVECNPYSEGDDDSAQMVTCGDQMEGAEFFHVCTQSGPPYYLNATEVWCDGPHKADCACTLDPQAAAWPAGLLALVGAVALALHRRR